MDTLSSHGSIGQTKGTQCRFIGLVTKDTEPFPQTLEYLLTTIHGNTGLIIVPHHVTPDPCTLLVDPGSVVVDENGQCVHEFLSLHTSEQIHVEIPFLDHLAHRRPIPWV